jgi:hypothetical protein
MLTGSLGSYRMPALQTRTPNLLRTGFAAAENPDGRHRLDFQDTESSTQNGTNSGKSLPRADDPEIFGGLTPCPGSPEALGAQEMHPNRPIATLRAFPHPASVIRDFSQVSRGIADPAKIGILLAG